MSQITPRQSNRNAQSLKSAVQNRTAVLHLTPDLELSPLAREVVDLAIQTHRAGWRPLIVSSGGSLVLEAERAAVRHSQYTLKNRNMIGRWHVLRQLEKLVERERPVLVHAHGHDVVALAVRLAQRKGLPLLVDIKEPVPVTPRMSKLFQIAAAQGARFRVPSVFMLNHLAQDMKLDPACIAHIHPGIDLQWFDASRVTPERINQLYRLWRLPEQSTVIVCATPFATGFGHRDLIEALTALKGTDLYAVLIGDDRTSPGMRAQIEKMVEANGLEGKIIMPENCTDWPAACWLSSLIVAVNAMPRGQGPELLAAQAIGRPVIVTDCGANAEMVKANETAWVIPMQDKDSLVAALREALSMSPARRIDLALCTRDFVENTFPMDVWRDSIFALYDTMLARTTLAVAA